MADLELDTDTLTLSRAGQVLVLNPLRLRILALLMRASPRVVTRAQIEQAIWGDRLTDSDALRTPITIIRDAAQLLVDDDALSPASRQRAQMIQRAAADLGEMPDLLLALAREPQAPAGRCVWN